MYGRRSAGKRLRLDESQQYNEENDSNDAQEEAFDPIAFYQQQRSEMLIDQASHVQASQSEIQQAQLDAQLRDRMHQEPSITGKLSKVRWRPRNFHFVTDDNDDTLDLLSSTRFRGC